MARGTRRQALGQHYLRDQGVIQQICDATPDQGHLWEIGCGDGALTVPLLERHPESYTIFEKDQKLIDLAEQKWPDVHIVSGDAVQTLAEYEGSMPDFVVANLPYSAATAILRQFFAPKYARIPLIFMFQKEVADRIMGLNPSDRGPMSVLSNSLYTVRKLLDVPAGAFAPPPKVDSTVLGFEPLATDPVRDIRAQSGKIFGFCASLFGARRKTVRNNLRQWRDQLDQVDEQLLQLRPERLSIEQILALYKLFSS